MDAMDRAVLACVDEIALTNRIGRGDVLKALHSSKVVEEILRHARYDRLPSRPETASEALERVR